MIKNRKEKLIHTVIFVFFMALFMSIYNVFLHHGVNVNSLKEAWIIFPFSFLVAFLLEWFIVGKHGFKIAYKMHKEHHSDLRKQLVTALLIVSGMATSMSLYGALLSEGLSENVFNAWLNNIIFNLPFAYFLVVVVVGPLVGFLFRKIFPIGSLIDVNSKKIK